MKIEKGQINVSVANMYREASYQSEVVNQGLLGESVTIEKKEKDFSLIRLNDGYQGWLSNHQWVKESKNKHKSVKIRSHFVNIYNIPDSKGKCIRDATIGTKIKVLKKQKDWYEIFLPDGLHGWIHQDSVTEFPDCTRQNIVLIAREFLGYPYYWGGRSSRGFDCSGLTQLVFSLFGINLPRDSWMQHREGQYCGENPLRAQAGDLYFFSENGSKVTHVGISIGEGRFIHARGMVRENSLNSINADFSIDLFNSFVDVRTFF